MTQGKVKWWNDSKGYGFIDVDGRDIYCHYTAIEFVGFKTLRENETVTVEVLETPKGPQAVRVIRDLSKG